jgi:Flp pilus assembly protein TadG
VAAEFVLTLAFLFALGLSAFQFFGLGLTALKVGHAAQEAAYVAASDRAPETAAGQTPCWSVLGGLRHPEGFTQAEVCRTVTQNLGDLNPDLAVVRVSRGSAQGSAFTVTVTYAQPVTSPLLRWLMGPLFITSSEASSV